MPAEMLTENRTDPPPTSTPTSEDELRAWARKHVERVRKLKRDAAVFVLGMVALTGVWAIVQWQDNGRFERLSDNGNPGDWQPWIFYVALVWGFLLGLDVLRTYFDRPTTEAEVEREVKRLQSRS
jgi:2TM domain